MRRRVLVGAVLGALFALGWWAGGSRAANGLYSGLDLFVEVLQTVQANYVDPVDTGKLVTGAMRGVAHGLDPWSRYLDPEEFRALRGVIQGAFDGIGASVDERGGWPVVIAPIEGSPAWDAGLEPGDVITKVDGHSTFGLSPDEMSSKLRGVAGTEVTLTVARDDAEHDLKLLRRRVTVKNVPYAFVGRAGRGLRAARTLLLARQRRRGRGLRHAARRGRARARARPAWQSRRHHRRGGQHRRPVPAAGRARHQHAGPRQWREPALRRDAAAPRADLAAGGAGGRRQRLGLRDPGRRTSRPRSRRAGGRQHVRQGRGAADLPAARLARRAAAHGVALPDAQRAFHPQRAAHRPGRLRGRRGRRAGRHRRGASRPPSGAPTPDVSCAPATGSRPTCACKPTAPRRSCA